MKIAFTGGGTAGHAMVNTILIPFLQKMDCHMIYLGSHNGLEKEMVRALASVKYYGIRTGKLRRYFSKENFKDIFSVAAGSFDAYRILKAERPQVLYSGGGYVSFPVVIAAALLKIPVLIRETDLSIGLANRLCIPFAKKVFTAFPDTQKMVSPKITSGYSGMLVRPSLFDADNWYVGAGRKPLCLIMGGSSGARKINEVVWESIDDLTRTYEVIHICGKGNLNRAIRCDLTYHQFEYVNAAMGKLLNAADVVVTRCGSNAILETLALGKRTVCIPIGSQLSRGEQKLNAAFAVTHGNAILLEEQLLNGKSLNKAINQALKLQNDTPFQITYDRLLENIETHVNEIYDVGLKNLEKDFFRSLTKDTDINFKVLSNMELSIYEEIVSAFGDD